MATLVQKVDRERIKALLTEAITVLCKNGLGYKYTCAVEGLLGITLDEEEIFLVNINETIAGATKRPTPEQESTTKPETGSPSGGSPAGTPRRRRRRSNSGGTDRASPAKRANYGSGEEQQQTGGDVIVIKEEVSQEEFSDFYGDTGDGQDDTNSQYALQQQQQAEQYGAGCSQWDTSQTQSGQSDWPSFAPTQQQQHAISQAASSAMLSPSQLQTPPGPTASRFPCGSLRARDVREVLEQCVVQPLSEPRYTIAAARLSWFNQSPEYLERISDQLTSLRAQLDDYMTALPGLEMFISAVTATRSGVKKDQQASDMRIYPGVSYWLVMDSTEFSHRDLCSYLQGGQLGTTMKLLLQPYQRSEKDVKTALFSVLKDTQEGVVRGLVDASAGKNLGLEAGKYNIVRAYVPHEDGQQIINAAQPHLDNVRYPIEISTSAFV